MKELLIVLGIVAFIIAGAFWGKYQAFKQELREWDDQ